MNKGFDVYTDFSDKVVIQKSNLKNFIKKTTLSRKKYNKFFNGYIGFFGYELCCELIGVKIPNQQSNNFYKSIFYKPQTVIKIRKNIRTQSILSNFKSLDNLKKSKIEENSTTTVSIPHTELAAILKMQ